MRSSTESPADTLPPEVALAFAPLHKRALGIATGTAAGLLVFLVTVLDLLLDRGNEVNLWLLGNYFAGYTPTWPGAFIGLAWGFFVGFVAGWFVAFCRNLVLAASLFWIRARSELQETRDFLDHI